MQNLRAEFGDEYPGSEKIFECIHRLTLPLSQKGELNFLFSNGEFLISHCSTQLTYIVRKYPFTSARLKDQDVKIDFGTVTTEQDQVAVIATTPLTNDEQWEVIPPGSMAMFKQGHLVSELKTHAWIKKPAPSV